jgi:hydroxyethylthiazole kinase
MLGTYLEQVRVKGPLVHNITNYVTVNDCANILLACGGSPIMSDDVMEVEEITSICGGLNINIGTLNQSTIPSMFLAGKKANECMHPVILDPVGAGASKLRTTTALKLMEEVQFTVIRGNISEIKTLAFGYGSTKGVDADVTDVVTEDNLEDVISFARKFAIQSKAIIAITGAIDLVVGEDKAVVIRNGHPVMAKITGSGCMLTALIAAYLTANHEAPLLATAAAISAMGVSGELAHEKMLINHVGNSSFRNYLIDEIYNLSGEELNLCARYQVKEFAVKS